MIKAVRLALLKIDFQRCFLCLFLEGVKKAMLSQLMGGKTEKEIVATREKAIQVLEEKGYEMVNTFFTDE